MSSVAQLGYVGVGASNLDAWEQYATEVLGMQVYRKGADGSLFLRMDEFHHRIVVHPDPSDDVLYLGWGLPNREEMEEVAGQLRANGFTVTEATREEARARNVIELLKFEDPNGVPSELFYGLEVCYPDPFNSPRPIGGFVTENMGLGHVLLNVQDVESNLKFYRDVLGMRVTDYVIRPTSDGGEAQLVFMHCNSRHHSMAFGKLPIQKKLTHIMVQVENLDDVGLTYDLVQERQIPLVMTIGKHMNDHMLSFYMANPSGWAIEYGHGGRQVDDATWEVQYHAQGDIWGHQMVGPSYFREEPEPAAAER